MSSSSRVPTVSDILKDGITALASLYWPTRPVFATAPGATAAPVATPDSTPVKKTPGKNTPAKSSGKKKPKQEEEIDQPVPTDTASSSNFSNDLVVRIFKKELCVSNNQNRIQLLEFSCYLEHYLWPYFSSTASFEHLLSIVLMLNEKCREGVNAFDSLMSEPDKFELFFKAVVSLWMDSSKVMSGLQRSYYIHFLINVYMSLENATIRRCCLQYLSLPLWSALSTDRLVIELDAFPPLKKHWQHLLKEKGGTKSIVASDDTEEVAPSSAGKKRGRQSAGGGSASKAKKKKGTPVATASSSNSSGVEPVSSLAEEWVPRLVTDFLAVIEGGDFSAEYVSEHRLYVERFLEFTLDLLSQLPTRRFLNAYLDDTHFIVRLRRAAGWASMSLVSRLTVAIDDLMHFEIMDQTGKALTRSDVMAAHWARLHTVQEVAHKHSKDTLRDLIFSSTGELGKEDVLRKYLSLLEPAALFEFAVSCHLLSHRDLAQGAGSVVAGGGGDGVNVEFAMSVIVEKLTHRRSQLDALNQSALYPTEGELWDANILPSGGFKYTGDAVLALPKLNLQFLTMHDYLLRNYTLFKLESSYEIRQDLVDAVKRMAPKQALSNGPVTFGGWARMAMPMSSFRLTLISKPSIGDVFPREVRAVIEVDLSRFKGDIRAEWEQLREHDVVFMLAIQNPRSSASASDEFRSERKELAAGRKPRSTRVSDSTGASSIEEDEFDFPAEYGVRHVRGAEIIEVRDEDDVVLNDFTRPDQRKGHRVGHRRRLLVRLDPSQYYQDSKQGASCYEELNLLVRRKAKENNFRAVLETIRSLINTEAIGRAVPQWLYDVLLGYGDPASAQYRNMPKIPLSQLSSGVVNTVTNVSSANSSNMQSLVEHDEVFDYVDTFLSAEHVRESFPDADITFIAEGVSVSESAQSAHDNMDVVPATASATKKGKKGAAAKKTPTKRAAATATTPETGAATTGAITDPPPPYRLMVRRPAVESGSARESVVCVGYRPPNKGPYPADTPPVNTVRYSSVQLEAIRSGMNQGLTLVVGPPGTGKTDVAVQIIVNLYHNFPTQKILLVTHSNAALNDLFVKLMQRDVDQRHLLRLGSGEQALQSAMTASAVSSSSGDGEVFSKQGRVDWSLARRLQLLGEIQRLAETLRIPGDVGYTCETAEYFYLEHVGCRMDRFRQAMAAATDGTPVSVKDAFPFSEFFSDTAEPLFDTGEHAELVSVAEGCFMHIDKIFVELRDYRAFELLRTQGHRADYLLTKQARIVAMTCTHAAMTRSRLVELGFKYDSLIMEEAAQILEVETLIPMLLQNTDEMEGCRLKRAVLIGDHNQLPPVVKHVAFQKHSKLDQSMFTRFVRLGVPSVQLDRQGRARAEIASLYSWRYSKQGSVGLGNLPFVNNCDGEYGRGNTGLLYNYQLIDVPAFNGKGEHCPVPHFYQNLGEAEYVVAVFQYMRLLGYPAHKISIVTSYNGQKNLIRDVLAQRCKNPVFGYPAAVTTVDKYQGQQNDYVLLSLVRTESVGHLRDVRRLIVALSRARLGLYVFCRKALFENCYELSPAFSQLCARPSQLQLVAGEGYPTSRPVTVGADAGLNVHPVSDVTEMGVLVYQMVQQAQQQQNDAMMSIEG